MTITGTGFRVIGRVDIVDGNGVTIDDTVRKNGTGTGGYFANGVDGSWNSDYTNLDINGSGFGNIPFLDSVAPDSRRIRIWNPWATAGHSSPDLPEGKFTLSAIPIFTTPAATFTGGGMNGTIGNIFIAGNGYDNNSTVGVTQSLVINASNFLGVERIQFEDNASNPFGGLDFRNITPVRNVPPAAPYSYAAGSGQIIFHPDTNSIEFEGGVFDLNATFLDSNSTVRRQIRLFTVGGRQIVTPAFDTNSSLN